MTRLDPQPWMLETATQALFMALAKAGITARFVGGCVRDAILGLDIVDIDIATPARPEEVMPALAAAGLKTVPTGIAHGTVTAIIPPRHFEITTLRRDVETFGRHARVAFDADWAADAARRDFTINAIYLDLDGTLHDPVGGLADLAIRRVRFVGETAQRISEDVLRVLRYYRFEARFGHGGGDPDARAACRATTGLLASLSAERVAQEVMRLLALPDPLRALQMMREDGVLTALLPEATGLDLLRQMLEIVPQSDPLLRLGALLAVDQLGAAAVAERLKLSNADRDRLIGLAAPRRLDPCGETSTQRRALYRFGVRRYRDLARLLAAEGKMSRERLAELSALADRWEPPVFPVGGRDVVALGVAPGRGVGELLAQTRQWWEDSDFAPDREAALAHLRVLIAAR